ncbi:ABC transporter ATP-binding protein [Sphingomonas sp. LHG3443-2]|uniref:ABC transporter ATP-binding protein n=1 Tax=Sphingomonas sp. LHG3443-2 TaxID=2804639 RepID=UPI003CF6E7C9
MTEPPLVETRDLRKEYKLGGETVHAVDGVWLTIRRGEFVAVMGASGSGKSTFMNLVGALDLPTEGEMLFDGQELAHLSSDELAAIRNRKIGFVFQQFNLLARTSALDNAATPLIYAGVPLAKRRERAAAKLAAMGLGDRMDHTPAKLSGGQQQRVAIARALVTEPLMLLADEPTGALDTATSEEIMRLFTQLNEGGITVVLVTHEPDIAQFAKRRILFRDGKVVEDRPVTDRRLAA